MSDTITLPREEIERALKALEADNSKLWASEKRDDAITTLRARLRCPACQGNDADAPCAYPSEGKPGCWRDKRLAQPEQRPEPVAWRPIETAPKDNKRPLYLARFVDGELVEIDFDGAWEFWQESWEMPHVQGWDWVSARGIEDPTHWAYQDEPPPQRQELSEEVRSVLTKHVPKLAELMRMPNAEWVADEHNAAVAALRALERKVRG